MKKGSHIHTDFIRFIIEKYHKPEKEESENETPEEVDDIEKPIKKKKKIKPLEVDDNPVEDDELIEDEEDDEVIEKLLDEYKKIKRQYESHTIQNRK